MVQLKTYFTGSVYESSHSSGLSATHSFVDLFLLEKIFYYENGKGEIVSFLKELQSRYSYVPKN